jgi:hypothetical protein
LAPPLYRLQVGQTTLDGMISDGFMWCQTGVQGSTSNQHHLYKFKTLLAKVEGFFCVSPTFSKRHENLRHLARVSIGIQSSVYQMRTWYSHFNKTSYTLIETATPIRQISVVQSRPAAVQGGHSTAQGIGIPLRCFQKTTVT